MGPGTLPLKVIAHILAPPGSISISFSSITMRTCTTLDPPVATCSWMGKAGGATNF